MILFFLVFIIIMTASTWCIFVKAGYPGWAALIPFYSTIIILRITHRPLWWIFLLIMPIIGFIISFIVFIDLAKAFGKNVYFGIGLALFGYIFFPILGFGKARYTGKDI